MKLWDNNEIKKVKNYEIRSGYKIKKKDLKAGHYN